MKDKFSLIVCLVVIALFNSPVTASIPSYLRSLVFSPVENSGEEARSLICSIPALEGLPGIRFSALVIDLPSGNPVVLSGAGIFEFNIPEVFLLAHKVDMPPADTAASAYQQEIDAVLSWIVDAGMIDTHLAGAGSPDFPEAISSSTAADVAVALQIIHSGMDTPEVIELLKKPDMGEGQASAVAEGWDLYGWVDSGEDHKSFVLIAVSGEGRELGLILLSDDLCCEEKGDLAMMLLWEAVAQL